MIKKIVLPLLVLLTACQNRQQTSTTTNNKSFVMESIISQTIDSLVQSYGDADKLRIEKGVRNAASFWKESDGDNQAFSDYCKKNFVGDTVELAKLFDRISTNFETIFGSFNTITLGLMRPLHLDIGEVLPVDEAFGTYNPSTHFTDDFFGNKIAFTIALNFPYYSLEEKTTLGPQWSRKQWAYSRLGDVFDSRLPADVNQLVVNANTRSEVYIADYNIFAGKLVNNEGQTLFPADMKLLSHWNIRDEIKTNYGDPAGLAKQQMLYEVMKRIVSQEIPQTVINSDKYTWNPYTNKVMDGSSEVKAEYEPSTRYDVLLQFFHAQQQVDKYYPHQNTYILRNFEGDMEIPLADVEALFTGYMTSPQVQKVADVIKKRLGRNLEPFDIWYDGFKTRTSIPAETLDKTTRAKYPNTEAVQNDLPNILVKLGFTKSRAEQITSKVKVEPARGSGHAWGAESKDQKSLLRTRIFSNGMDYKGYNIAVHEFGHNVEQTIDLQDIDNYFMKGVPNTAFTEALAFSFQKNDLMLLGMKDNNPLQGYYNDLDNFWALYEIMGVSMVDIGTWKWLYENPDATAVQLKDAVNTIAKDVWNKYYAPVFGIKDQPILGIYSHMINAPLYLPNYAYGHIIEFQLAGYLEGKNYANEIERIYRQGKLIPQQWMQGAVGSKLSAQPMLDAAEEALTKIQ
jgi:hypothetical protein